MLKNSLAPLLGTILAFASRSAARQQSSPPQQTAPTPQANSHDKANDAQQATVAPANQPAPKDDRILYTLPNYLTVDNEERAPRLSSGEKYKLVAKTVFDWTEFPYVGIVAALGQAQNSEPSYGQGAAGYGKRYGTVFADSAISSFMTGAVFPSMLKEDPRYYRMGPSHSGAAKRAVYCITRIFVTRTDSGGAQPNYSEFAGNAVAAGIANLYHPRSDRTLANTLSIWGTQTMWDAVSNELKEFWPDLHDHLARKKRSSGS